MDDKDPVLTNENYIGVVPPDPNRPKQGTVLKSKEEVDGNVQAEGPKVIPPPENAPEPQILVSKEEQALADGEVSYDGPETLKPNEHQEEQQEIQATNSPNVADAPPAPESAEALDTNAEGNAPEAAEGTKPEVPEEQHDSVIGDQRAPSPEPTAPSQEE